MRKDAHDDDDSRINRIQIMDFAPKVAVQKPKKQKRNQKRKMKGRTQSGYSDEGTEYYHGEFQSEMEFNEELSSPRGVELPQPEVNVIAADTPSFLEKESLPSDTLQDETFTESCISSSVIELTKRKS